MLADPVAGWRLPGVSRQPLASDCAPRLRILTFTTLFPNAAQPAHGVFVENRLRQLLATGRVAARVVAPVPWFPFNGAGFGRYAAFARAPTSERRAGVAVEHPRYLVIPKLGMNVTPFTLAAAAKPVLRRIIDSDFDFDLIDAHYFYPDGVAAVLLARHFEKPVTITARGTDINLIPRYAIPRGMIRWAARRADGLVTVCQALKDALVELGVEAERIRVLRNGVDLAVFRPVERKEVRERCGVRGPVLLSVGALIARKAHDLIIRALPELPDATLLIVGEGPEEETLRKLAERLEVADRVRLLGAQPHAELRDLYGAADVLVLPSSREGWANVLLEAMACGTPVVASNVWGTPEVVAQPEAGLLLESRTPEAIVKSVCAVLSDPPDRDRTRAYAERFTWDETSEGLLDLFAAIVKR